MADQIQSALTILRRKQVQARVGLGRSSLYELMKRREFPRQIQLSSHSVGWLQSEIDAWIAQRVEQSRKAG